MKRSSKTGWRRMKTAPKDKQILLAYPSFSGDGTTFVNQGRWIDLPYTAEVQRAFFDRQPFPEAPEGHWEISYLATIQHGGAASGFSVDVKAHRIDPIAWRELPTY